MKLADMLLDPEDEHLRSTYPYLDGSGYAIRTVEIEGKRTTESLHRVLAKAKKTQHVDHINGVRLDNRKENLRLCTKAENCRNKSKQRNNKSGYKGVSWNSARKLWNARININYAQFDLGYFKTAEEAALEYNEAALFLHGKFAKLNEV